MSLKKKVQPLAETIEILNFIIPLPFFNQVIKNHGLQLVCRLYAYDSSDCSCNRPGLVPGNGPEVFESIGPHLLPTLADNFQYLSIDVVLLREGGRLVHIFKVLICSSKFLCLWRVCRSLGF